MRLGLGREGCDEISAVTRLKLVVKPSMVRRRLLAYISSIRRRDFVTRQRQAVNACD